MRQLAAHGASVAFVARTAEAVTETAWDTGAIGIVGEVGRNDDTHAIALQITGNLGGLNVLINGASRGDGRGSPPFGTISSWQKAIS